MDIDITNSARFGTKGLGSTTVTWIKWNADGCFGDKSRVKQTGQKDVCLFKDLMTPPLPTQQSRVGQCSRFPACGHFTICGWQFCILNTEAGTGIIAKRKEFALKGRRAPALPTDWLHPTAWKQNGEILPDTCTLHLLGRFFLNTRIKFLSTFLISGYVFHTCFPCIENIY